MTKQKDTKPESGFEGERIAKVMARAGLCSRREAESLDRGRPRRRQRRKDHLARAQYRR